MIHLLRGDDSAKITIVPTIADGFSTAGGKLSFDVADFHAEFTDLSGNIEFSFPAEWTERQPIGRQFGKWSFRDSQGKTMAANNTFPIYLTDIVQDVSGQQQASISFSAGNALSGLTFDANGTTAELMSFLVTAVSRLGASVSH